MKNTRARDLALKLESYGLIDNSTVLETQAIISGLLFENPQLPENQIVNRALKINYATFDAA